jgi:hypothetical protein
MPHNATTAIFWVLIVIPCLLCVWAMIMHIIIAANTEREHFSFGRLFVGSYFFERYNRTYCLIFLCAFAFLFSVAVAANILIMKGVIEL